MDLETLLKFSGVNNSEVTQKELEDNANSETPAAPKKTSEAVGVAADPIMDLCDDVGCDPDHPIFQELVRYLDVDQIAEFVADYRRNHDMPNGMDEAEVNEDDIDEGSIKFMHSLKAKGKSDEEIAKELDMEPAEVKKAMAKTEEVQTESATKINERMSREDLGIDDEEMANLMSAEELKKELIDDLNHLYAEASENDFTDTDHIIDEMGDYFNDMHMNADDDTLEAYAMARDLADADPAEVVHMAERLIKGLGGIIESISEDKVEEDFLGDIMALAGLHQPVEEEQTNEGAMKKMVGDVEDGMDKAEFEKTYPGMGDTYDEIKKEIEDGMEESVNEVVESQDEDTVEITKEDLSNLLDLAGITPTQATDNELGEYANSPDEDYMDADVQLNKMAGGLNGPKGQHKKEGPGDNPLAAKLADKLQAMLDDLNK
jgi:hypothetical protein